MADGDLSCAQRIPKMHRFSADTKSEPSQFGLHSSPLLPDSTFRGLANNSSHSRACVQGAAARKFRVYPVIPAPTRQNIRDTECGNVAPTCATGVHTNTQRWPPPACVSSSRVASSHSAVGSVWDSAVPSPSPVGLTGANSHSSALRFTPIVQEGRITAKCRECSACQRQLLLHNLPRPQRAQF